MIKWFLTGIGDFVGGMVGEFIDWLVAVVTELGDRLAALFSGLIHIFTYFPKTGKLLLKTLRGVFWGAPDIVFNIIIVAVAVTGIILIIKLVLKLFGR